MELSKWLQRRHWQTEQNWSYINHYAVDVCQLPNDGIWKKILCVQLISNFSSSIYLLPVSKISHLSCCEHMNTELMDLRPNLDRSFLTESPESVLEWPAVPVLCTGCTCGCVFALAAAWIEMALKRPVLAWALSLPLDLTGEIFLMKGHMNTLYRAVINYRCVVN